MTKDIPIVLDSKEKLIIGHLYDNRVLGKQGVLEYLDTPSAKEYYFEIRSSLPIAKETVKKEIEDIKDDKAFFLKQGYPYDINDKYLFKKFLNDLNDFARTKTGRQVFRSDEYYQSYLKLYDKLEKMYEEKFKESIYGDKYANGGNIDDLTLSEIKLEEELRNYKADLASASGKEKENIKLIIEDAEEELSDILNRIKNYYQAKGIKTHFNNGGSVNGEKVTNIIISNKAPLSSTLQALTGEHWNAIDFTGKAGFGEFFVENSTGKKFTTYTVEEANKLNVTGEQLPSEGTHYEFWEMADKDGVTTAAHYYLDNNLLTERAVNNLIGGYATGASPKEKYELSKKILSYQQKRMEEGGSFESMESGDCGCSHDDKLARGGNTAWYKEAVDAKAPYNLGGWRKELPAEKRRKLAVRSRDGKLTRDHKYLSAGRALQALANVTTDSKTKELASEDAQYFFSKLKGSKMAMGGKLGDFDKESFVDYIHAFYGKDGIYKDQFSGGASDAEIESAVDSYLGTVSEESFGGGDSLDRERVRDIMLKGKGVSVGESIYAGGGKASKVTKGDVVTGARFKKSDGTVFIIDNVYKDSEGDVMVESSFEGGGKGNYRDEISEVVEILNEEGAVKVLGNGGTTGEDVPAWRVYLDKQESFQVGTPAVYHSINWNGDKVEQSGEIVMRNGVKGISLYRDSNYSGSGERFIEPNWNNVESFSDANDRKGVPFKINPIKYGNGGSLTEQKLYVDYAGGKFVSWFYSEGDRYKGASSHDYDDILRFSRKNDFTKIVLTDEAKMFNRREKGRNIYSNGGSLKNSNMNNIEIQIAKIDSALGNKNISNGTKTILEGTRKKLVAQMDAEKVAMREADRASKKALKAEAERIKAEAEKAKAEAIAETRRAELKAKHLANGKAIRHSIRKPVKKKVKKAYAKKVSAPVRKKVKKSKFKGLPKKVKKFNKGRSASDLNRDKKRDALPAGKRVARKGWMNQYGASKGGGEYVENRAGHADISKKHSLGEGGNV